MFSTLNNRTFRHLFLAQLSALLGTGLTTVALGLLAFDLAGRNASVVLGLALTIKMVAYVTCAPIASALLRRLNRRFVLASLDVIRALVALSLPFVSEIWQIYALIFVLQIASAGFTPLFQATIPDVLKDEAEYTNALSLSRLAMDLESLVSPIAAALLLGVFSYDALFLLTGLGFIGSAFLVVSVFLPYSRNEIKGGIFDKSTRGMRIYLKTPRLRGLLALNWSVASLGAMVFVNTVVIVRDRIGLAESAVGIALAGFGAGSILAAIILPRLLKHLQDRVLMISGAGLGAVCLLCLALYVSFAPLTLFALSLGWFFVGFSYSMVLTPAGRVLSRSAHSEDRPDVFAAQFTLSHACWLVNYPLAGWLLAEINLAGTMSILSASAALGAVLALVAWRKSSEESIYHIHTDLPPDHPHVKTGLAHSHPIVIDELHLAFPPQG